MREMIYLNSSGILFDCIIESTGFERLVALFFEPLNLLRTFP